MLADVKQACCCRPINLTSVEVLRAGARRWTLGRFRLSLDLRPVGSGLARDALLFDRGRLC